MTTPLQRPSWRKSIIRHLALTAILSSSCRIYNDVPLLVKAITPATLTPRSSLRSPPCQSNFDAPLSNELTRSASLLWISRPSFIRTIQWRVYSSTKVMRKDVDLELSLSMGHVIAKIRGGSSVGGSESSDDEGSLVDHYNSEESDNDSEYDGGEYDSDDEANPDDGDDELIPRSSLASSLLSKSQDPTVDEYDDLLTPPAMHQFMVSIGVMVLSNRIGILNKQAVRVARFAFLAYVVSVQLFLIYVRMRAKALNDRTAVTISNPLASLVQNGAGGGIAGGERNFLVKALADQVLSTQTTVLEYDLKQAKKMNGGLLFPMVFLYFLHFKLKQVQPLLMQTATGILNLVYSPLFQVYVLGRNLERPFKPPSSPMMDALKAQQQGPMGGKKVGDGGNDALVLLEGEEGEDEIADDSEEEEGDDAEEPSDEEVDENDNSCED